MSAGAEVSHRVGHDGLYYDVRVPIHRHGVTDTLCVHVKNDFQRNLLTVTVTGELLDQAPEAVTAAVQLAFRAVAEDRKTYGDLWKVA